MRDRLVFGTANLHHLMNFHERQRILIKAYDIGFRRYDTAPAYGNGISEYELGIIPEDTLALYYWVDNGWVQEPSSIVDLKNNTVAATPDHLSKWAVFGVVNRIFLPMTVR